MSKVLPQAIAIVLAFIAVAVGAAGWFFSNVEIQHYMKFRGVESGFFLSITTFCVSVVAGLLAAAIPAALAFWINNQWLEAPASVREVGRKLNS